LKGNDGTVQILQIYSDLRRSDINYLLLSGLIVSIYDVIYIKKIFSSLKIPVIGIAYSKSAGMKMQ